MLGNAEIATAVDEEVVEHVALLEGDAPGAGRVPTDARSVRRQRRRQKMFRDAGGEGLPVDLANERVSGVRVGPNKATKIP